MEETSYTDEQEFTKSEIAFQHTTDETGPPTEVIKPQNKKALRRKKTTRDSDDKSTFNARISSDLFDVEQSDTNLDESEEELELEEKNEKQEIEEDENSEDYIEKRFEKIKKPRKLSRDSISKSNFHPKLTTDFFDTKSPTIIIEEVEEEEEVELEEKDEEQEIEEDPEVYKQRRFEIMKKIKENYKKNLHLKKDNDGYKDVMVKYHGKSSAPFVFIHNVTNQPLKTYYQDILKWKTSEDLRKEYPSRIKFIKTNYETINVPLERMFRERLEALEMKLLEFNKTSPKHDQRKIIRDRYITQLIKALKDQVVSQILLIKKKAEFKQIYEDLVTTRNQIAENTGMTPDEYERLRVERYARIEKLASMEIPWDHDKEVKISKPKSELCPQEMSEMGHKLCKRIAECRKRNAELSKAIKLPESYVNYLKMQVDTYQKLNAKFDEDLKNQQREICELIRSVNGMKYE